MFKKMSLESALATPSLRLQWAEAMRGTNNLYAMYQSIPWLDCIAAAGAGEVTVLVSDAGGDHGLQSIAPLSRANIPLRFQLTTGIGLALNYEVLELLGGRPVGEQGLPTFVQMVEAVWKHFPTTEGIYLKSIAEDSALWCELARQDWRVGESLAYKPSGDRPLHYVRVPATFDEYIAEFPSKQRYNLKKKIKRMREAFGGNLVARRVTQAEEVDYLVESATVISNRSWRARELARPVPESLGNAVLLRKVAERGMLRAFVLSAAGTPCAFIVGYLHEGGTFHYADLAFDESFASHSPGTVLLWMAIESLIENDRIANLNFGVTDAQYKQVFGNRHVQDAALLILKPSLSSALVRRIHESFNRAKGAARLAIRSRSAVQKAN